MTEPNDWKVLANLMKAAQLAGVDFAAAMTFLQTFSRLQDMEKQTDGKTHVASAEGRAMRVLFTGGGGAATQALYDLLSPRYEVEFADANVNARPVWLSPHRWHTIPEATAPHFTKAMLELCASEDINVLVPGVEEDLIRLAIHRTWGDFGQTRVILPHESFVGAHLDKLRSMRVLEDAGIPVPWTYRCAPVPFGIWWQYPALVKPREGRGSRHVAIVNTEAELDAHVLLSGLTKASFIVQELLQGQEYTVTMVGDQRGTLRAVVPVRVALKKGITVRAATDHDEGVIAACVKIHAVQPVSGIYNIQCIKTADGAVKPFEINPRISTTTCLAMAAGVDVLGLALDEGGLAPFQDGLTLQRTWRTAFA
jgi:carbamoyl-phosphate synthase large subunit